MTYDEYIASLGFLPMEDGRFMAPDGESFIGSEEMMQMYPDEFSGGYDFLGPDGRWYMVTADRGWNDPAAPGRYGLTAADTALAPEGSSPGWREGDRGVLYDKAPRFDSSSIFDFGPILIPLMMAGAGAFSGLGEVAGGGALAGATEGGITAADVAATAAADDMAAGVLATQSAADAGIGLNSGILQTLQDLGIPVTDSLAQSVAKQAVGGAVQSGIQGGDPLEGALMGGAIGGLSSGIGGLTAGLTDYPIVNQMAGSGALSGIVAGATGNDPLQGALAGATSAGIGGVAGNLTSGLTGSPLADRALGSAGASAVYSGIQGGDPLQAALSSAMNTGVKAATGAVWDAAKSIWTNPYTGTEQEPQALIQTPESYWTMTASADPNFVVRLTRDETTDEETDLPPSPPPKSEIIQTSDEIYQNQQYGTNPELNPNQVADAELAQQEQDAMAELARQEEERQFAAFQAQQQAEAQRVAQEQAQAEAVRLVVEQAMAAQAEQARQAAQAQAQAEAQRQQQFAAQQAQAQTAEAARIEADRQAAEARTAAERVAAEAAQQDQETAYAEREGPPVPLFAPVGSWLDEVFGQAEEARITAEAQRVTQANAPVLAAAPTQTITDAGGVLSGGSPVAPAATGAGGTGTGDSGVLNALPGIAGAGLPAAGQPAGDNTMSWLDDFINSLSGGDAPASSGGGIDMTGFQSPDPFATNNTPLIDEWMGQNPADPTSTNYQDPLQGTSASINGAPQPNPLTGLPVGQFVNLANSGSGQTVPYIPGAGGSAAGYGGYAQGYGGSSTVNVYNQQPSTDMFSLANLAKVLGIGAVAAGVTGLAGNGLGGSSTTTQTSGTPGPSQEELELIKLNAELAKRQLASIDQLQPLQKQLLEASQYDLAQQQATSRALNAAVTPEQQAELARAEFERSQRLGPIQDQLLQKQMDIINTNGAATPEQLARTRAVADAAIAAGTGDINTQIQRGIGLISDEVANARGLRLTDTPILREATLLTDSGNDQIASLVRAQRASEANANLTYPLQVNQAQSSMIQGQQTLNDAAKNFQDQLRQQANANRMAIIGQSSGTGIGLANTGNSSTALNALTSARLASGTRTSDTQQGIGLTGIGQLASGIGNLMSATSRL